MNKDDLQYILSRNDEWIRGADQKVSIFLAFQGVVLTILLPGLYSWFSENYFILPCETLYLSGLGLVLMFFGIIEAAGVIIPRLNNTSPKKSFLYFGDIAGKDLSEYKKELNLVTNEKFEDELINQIHMLSKISTRKHRHFKYSIVFFLSGVFFLLAGLIAYFFSYGYL